MNQWFGRWRHGFGGMRRALRRKEEGDAALQRRDYEMARLRYEESLHLFREMEHPGGIFWVRFGLAELAMQTQDFSTAREQYTHCVSLARNLHNPEYLAASLNALAAVASLQGEEELVERLCRESLELWKSLENVVGVANTLQQLGHSAADCQTARRHYEKALALHREHSGHENILAALCSLGHLAEPNRDNAKERACLDECIELCRVSGNEQTLAYALNNLGNIERYEGQLDRARELYCESLERKQRIGDDWAIAYTLEGCAALAAARQKGRLAAQLFGAAEAIRERLGAPLERNKQQEYARNVAEARETLGAIPFESAWNEGKALSVAQAVEAARAV